MRRSFSWDRAFFTNDGVLDDDELSSMIEGSENHEKHELQRIEEIELLEATLFEETEALTNKTSGIKALTIKDSQPKASNFSTKANRSSTSQASKVINNLKSSTPSGRRSTSSIPVKIKGDSPSKTPPLMNTKNKFTVTSNRSPKTSPASPISPGALSSKSISAVKQKSRGSSVPPRSTINNEKSSPTNARKRVDQKSQVVVAGSMSLKNKSQPFNSHPSSPSRLSNASWSSESSSSSASSSSSSLSSLSSSRGKRGNNVNQRALNTDRTRKQPQTGSISRSSTKIGIFEEENKSGKTRKLPQQKTVAVVTDLKQASRSSREQPSSGKGKSSRGVKNILLVSPEILDIKGKLNALKMEINMKKNSRMTPAESGNGGSNSNVDMDSSRYVGMI